MGETFGHKKTNIFITKFVKKTQFTAVSIVTRDFIQLFSKNLTN